jgi:hypothetical protein
MSEDPFPSSTRSHYRSYALLGGLRRRVVASIGVVVGWISFTLLYVAFWATGFSLFQNIIVIVVSLLVLFGVLVAAWVSYGLRFVDRWSH